MGLFPVNNKLLGKTRHGVVAQQQFCP